MPGRSRWLVAAAVLILASGCGGGQADRASSIRSIEKDLPPPTTVIARPTPSAPAPADIAASELVVVQRPECQELGLPIANYLLTGEANGVPALDMYFAQQRAELLTAPEEARRSLAVAGASQAMQQCDADMAASELQAAQQAAAAQQQQANAQAYADAMADYNALVAADDARAAAYASACAARGGFLEGGQGGVCAVNYPGSGDGPYLVALNQDGTFDSQTADWQRQQCQQYQQMARLDADDGYPWRRQPTYHPDTGVCEPGIQ